MKETNGMKFDRGQAPYKHGVISTSIRRRTKSFDVVSTLKRRGVSTGKHQQKFYL